MASWIITITPKRERERERERERDCDYIYPFLRFSVGEYGYLYIYLFLRFYAGNDGFNNFIVCLASTYFHSTHGFPKCPPLI